MVAAPMDTAGDIVQRISDRLGLNPADGWALYQVISGFFVIDFHLIL